MTNEQKDSAIKLRGLILSTSARLEFHVNKILASLVIPKTEESMSELLIEAFILRHLSLMKKMQLVREGLIAIDLFDEIKKSFNDLEKNFIPARNKAAHSLDWHSRDGKVGFGGFEFDSDKSGIILKKASLSLDDWEKFCFRAAELIEEVGSIAEKTKSVIIKQAE